MQLNNLYNGLMGIGSIFNKQPDAAAAVRGSADYPNINGRVLFYNTRQGVIVFTVVTGLPISSDKCKGSVFAFHIHSGASCTGNQSDPFAGAGAHYNPQNCPHPFHAGDMPPLFGNNGYAMSLFLTDRFTVDEIIGKTVIIHKNPDDFATQPSGNAGIKIACGEIR